MTPKRTAYAVYTSLILILGFLSCKKDSPNPPAITKQLVLPANSAAVIDASNQFAFKFFAASLQQDQAINNKLVSPFSIYTALSMVINGANSTTRDSIAKTLQLNGISIDDLNTLNKALITQMPGEDSKVTMDIANSIWYTNQGPQPLPAFLDTIKNDYDGLVQSLDFGNPASVNTINSWIAQKTKNKIPNLLNSIDPSEIMFLINAIYFNGSWQNGFKSSDTRNRSFHLQNGSTVDVPFMSATMNIGVVVDSAFTLAELPYGGGKSYDMYLLLPNDHTQPIEKYAAALDNTVLDNMLAKLKTSRVEVNLPKWEYTYSIGNMQPELAQLGMGIAFGAADFSNMYPVQPGTLTITRALHKTYIKVNEQGTEAAAVTVIIIGVTDSAPPPSITADHPFVYLLREKQSGTILFIGIVNNPVQN